MKVLNVMFQKYLGGIEQAFLDYNQALKAQGFNVLPLIHPRAMIRPYIQGSYQTIYNFNEYDFLAVLRLQKLINNEKPDCIITHGGRAANLVKKIKNRPPFIAVSHNYNFKPVLTADAIITITKNMRTQLISIFKPMQPIYTLPNMVEIAEHDHFITPNFRRPPVIGMICRFSKEKGIDIFLRALSILKSKNLAFKARLAGDGADKPDILKLINDFGLENHVEMLGWVDNKHEFYNSIDIFCMTSYSESFGIVLLEAFKAGKPSVVTMTAGPLEIATNGLNALLVPIGDYVKVAESIAYLMQDHAKANSIAAAAFNRVQDYSLANVSKRLKDIIEDVCEFMV